MLRKSVTISNLDANIRSHGLKNDNSLVEHHEEDQEDENGEDYSSNLNGAPIVLKDPNNYSINEKSNKQATVKRMSTFSIDMNLNLKRNGIYNFATPTQQNMELSSNIDKNAYINVPSYNLPTAKNIYSGEPTVDYLPNESNS